MRLRVAALLLVVPLVLGACSNDKGNGGGSKSGAGTAFADATCNDLAQWAAALQPAFTDLQNAANLDITDPTAANDALSKLSTEIEAAEKATTTLSDGISSRPAPDVDSGDQIKTTLVTTLNQLRDLGTQVRLEIDQFDVRTATPDSAAKLRTDLGNLTNNVASSLAALAPLLSQNEQLRAALQNSKTCQQAGNQFVPASS